MKTVEQSIEEFMKTPRIDERVLKAAITWDRMVCPNNHIYSLQNARFIGGNPVCPKCGA